jgi:hypothetical protein
MQAFDSGIPDLRAKPLSQKAHMYSKNNTNFLAMKGSLEPFKAVEYFNVANTFGSAGKGEFKARYGLNRPAQLDVSVKENLSAVIVKDGEAICAPGEEMSDGRCKPVITDIACQPGWVKQGGVCIKGEREFMDAVDTAKQGVTDNDGVTLKRMRKYMKEMATGDAFERSVRGPAQ